MAEELRLGFGEGSITEEEWHALDALFSDIGAETVLEIGSGYSTVLLSRAGYEVLSLETHPQWAARVAAELPDNGHIQLVTYPDLPQISRTFDVAFVDGPSGGGGDGRKAAMQLAHDTTGLVVIHDASRAGEKQAALEVFGNGWQAHSMAGRLQRWNRTKEQSRCHYAVFFAADSKYEVYGQCLVESMRRTGCTADVHALCYGDVQIEGAQCHDLLSYVPEKPDPHGLPLSKNLALKHARYAAVTELCEPYDVACLLDADMLVVAPQFWNLFDLIWGTSQAIGCNEKFKWYYGPKHQDGDGEPLFPEKRRAWAFHCNTPFIFTPKSWLPAFRRYNELAGESYEQNGERGVKRMGDIFCWNAAVMLEKREADLLLMPMERMTQVHHLHLSPERHLQLDGGYWHTAAGDLVYTLHGRPLNDGWLEGELRALKNYPATKEKDAVKRLRAVREFWQSHLTASPPSLGETPSLAGLPTRRGEAPTGESEINE